MKRLHTHYDNLKVTADASDEVIRAAYRALSQKHHPDRNPDNADAHRILSIINQSYAVLSDPQQRRAHDIWIAEQRRLAMQAQTQRQQHSASQRQAQLQHRQQAVAAYQRQREAVRPTRPAKYALHAWRQWLGMALVVLLPVAGWWWWQAQATPAVPAISTSLSATAPNGQALPAGKGYVAGYPVLRQRGRNVVQVDNSGLNSGVFAQLYELRGGKLTAIRSFYIPAGERFSVTQVGDGDFSLHYRRVDNGEWQISAPWLIENTERSGQYRQIDVKL